jgi:Uma2 family endonuclease
MIQRLGNELVDEDLVRYDVFRSLVQDGQKADLIDGVIYIASPDTRRSNSINHLVAYLIDGYTAARDIDGFTFISRFSCKITDLRAPEPDVGYVRPERMHLVQDQHMEGGPDIAVEIVSRDSRSRDYGEKRELYLAAGVSEYWIIDPLQQRTEFLALHDGRYQLMPLVDNRVFRCGVIPGFWLNVDWLLARPLPRAYRCLQEILASPAAGKDKPKSPPKKQRKRKG